jgi:hypothetical protein
MRALVLGVLLCACGDSREQARRAMVDPANSTCLRESGKYSDLTFCLDGRELLICNSDWCMHVPLDQTGAR